MQTLWQDLRYGARMLRKRPGFTLIAVATLALGIGANTAIFSVVNAVLFRPLPYVQPEQLVSVYDSLPSINFPRAGLSEAEFAGLRNQNRSFAEVAAWYWGGAALRGVAEPERITAPRATANFFRALGVNIALGRDFLAEEELAGKNNVVVLTHRFWQRKFAGDPAIIGRTLTLDEVGYTVIGVLPADFRAPNELQADTRIDGNLARPARDELRLAYVVAHCRHLWSGPSAARDESRSANDAEGKRAGQPAGQSQPRFNLILLGGFALLALGLGVVGIYGVVSSVVAQRTQEIGIRLALGAQTGDVLRLVLREGMRLSGLGIGLGLLASFALTRLIRNLLFGVSAVDLLTFGSIALLLTFVALVACWIPARRATKVDPMVALRGE
ncbi:MAG: ABC transporter permease [Blastocatellia bacterium]